MALRAGRRSNPIFVQGPSQILSGAQTQHGFRSRTRHVTFVPANLIKARNPCHLRSVWWLAYPASSLEHMVKGSKAHGRRSHEDYCAQKLARWAGCLFGIRDVCRTLQWNPTRHCLSHQARRRRQLNKCPSPSRSSCVAAKPYVRHCSPAPSHVAHPTTCSASRRAATAPASPPTAGCSDSRSEWDEWAT